MANTTFRFWFRKERELKNGVVPIFLIYQLKGQRKYLNTGIKLRSENWDFIHQQAIYLDKKSARRVLPNIDYDTLPLAKDIEEINDQLDAIVNDLKIIEKRYELDKKQYSAQMVIDYYNQKKSPDTKKEQNKTIVSDYIDKYIEEHRNTKAPASHTVFRSLKKHLIDYAQYAKIKILFTNIDKSFFAYFQNYLIEIKEMRNTTVAKQLSTLKTILNYADSCGIEINMNYRHYIIKREPLPVIALTQQEFNKLYYYDLSDHQKQVNSLKENNGKLERISNATLDKVRDFFCFSCVTGLRYSDINVLRHENVKLDAINITVVKTKQQLHIPLNEYALEILSKYKKNPTPLPRMTNQRLNEYIKVLAYYAGINDNIEVVRFKGVQRIVENHPKHDLIGMHTGRKTFCTLSLEKGMSAEQVMSISGHKDYKSFKRYVNITNDIKKQAIMKAWAMPKVLSIAN